MQVVSPNDMKFSGKKHLRSFDDSRFLQGFQRYQLSIIRAICVFLAYQGADMLIKILESFIPGIHSMPNKC
jgi:hypothetical protein